MLQIHPIFFIVIFSSPLFSANDEIGEIEFVQENVTIKPAQEDIIPGIAIAGRMLYNGDIIHSSEDGLIKFNLKGDNGKITMSGFSELQFDITAQFCQLELKYGKILTDFPADSDCEILTHSSQIKLNEGELWIVRNFSNEDKIYAISGSAQISSKITDLEIKIELGELVSSNEDNLGNITEFTEEMLPAEIFQKYKLNRQKGIEKIPFTVMNYFSDDPSSSQTFYDKGEKRKRFHFTLEAGAVSIEDAQYTKASLLPTYTGERLQLGYNLAGFIGLSDTAANLNTFSNLSQILAPLSFNFQSKSGGYNLKLGRINNLTFGYGMLLKRYTNTVSYPVKQDGGLVFDYQSDAGNYTCQLFTSSFGELASGGGLMGMYGSGVINLISPVRLGVGIVQDLNQFSSVADSLWKDVSPRKRSISGYQVDFTYELKSNLRNDTYLFGEFTALNYADGLRYIRSEPADEDTLDTKQGFERQSSFGILGPGIWWKIGHHRDIKIAFNYSSSLHIAPFFGETYNLERVHYVPSSIIENIDTTYSYYTIEEWNSMIKDNHIDEDSTAYYLPKDVYALLDPTKNTHNKIGFSAEYSYHYRNYYHYSFDISMLKETGTAESPVTYYTLGMDISINEGLIQGISEVGLYFNQYFTSDFMDNENKVFGASLGIKILQNVSLRMYRHDVFYDRNLDGNVDLNSTMGAGMVVKF